jgi:hypothetical protein
MRPTFWRKICATIWCAASILPKFPFFSLFQDELTGEPTHGIHVQRVKEANHEFLDTCFLIGS